MKLILTHTQRKREQIRNQICADYALCSAEYPHAKANEIFRTIATKYGMTIHGIRGILIRKGVYQPKR